MLSPNKDTMPEMCLNFDTGEYELIDRNGFSYTRGEFVYNWDVSVYEEGKAAEEEQKNDFFDDDEEMIFRDDESEEAYLFEEEDDYFEEEEGNELGINSDDFFGDDGII